MEELKPPEPDGPKCSVLHGRYELGRVLGQGTFAKVYMARNVRSGEAVAIKAVCKDKVIQSGMMEQIKREISVMKRVSHPNIVSLHEVMATRSKIYFSMELVRGGELFSRVARNGRLREDSARRYFLQLLSAVAFCHSRGVYHRDLKPENLLLDHNGTLKVADFGLTAFADHVRHDGLLHTTCGTPAYVAPEVIGRRGYDGAKADLWSCGVILYVLLAGFLPFQDENLIAMYKKIQRGDFKCPPWFSPDARRVVTRLLDPNPSTRITATKLLDAPWFRRSSVAAARMMLPPPPEAPAAAAAAEEEPERMNAFHLISLSEGFDLSPLFEDGGREEGVRFATREPASGVISRLEALRGMRVTKSGAMGVMLEGEEGRLSVEAEIFAVSPEVLLVEVRKAGGDNLEYQRFCSDELRPALKDIVWDTRGAAA